MLYQFYLLKTSPLRHYFFYFVFLFYFLILIFLRRFSALIFQFLSPPRGEYFNIERTLPSYIFSLHLKIQSVALSKKCPHFALVKSLDILNNVGGSPGGNRNATIQIFDSFCYVNSAVNSLSTKGGEEVGGWLERFLTRDKNQFM
jgi:hypothetical protein